MTTQMYLKPIPQPDGSIEFVPTDEPPVFVPPQAIELPYFLKREREYPKIADQLDMLWHMMDNNTIPGKGSEWYNAILAVKNNHPKP